MIKKKIWYVEEIFHRDDSENGFIEIFEIYENEETAAAEARSMVRRYEGTGEISQMQSLLTFSLVCYASENAEEQEALEDGLYVSIGWDYADTPALINEWFFKVEDESEKSCFDYFQYADDITDYVRDGVIQPDCGVLSDDWKDKNWEVSNSIIGCTD